MAFEEFAARRLVDLRPDNWDKFVRALNARFLVLEEQLGIQRQVSEAVLARGLQVIEDSLTPVIAGAEEAANGITLVARDLGLLLRATSASNLTIGTGTKVFVVAEGERNRFAAPLYVIAAADGNADQWMAGQVTGWDVETGALTVAVSDTRGAGAFAAWNIAVASIPPNIPPQAAYNIALAAIAGLTAEDVQAGIEELHTAIGAKASLASPAFTGTPTAPTAAGGTNTTQIATTAFVKAALDALIAAAPGALDTLDELAAALGDDANFAATVTTALAGKVAKSGDTLSGPLGVTPTTGRQIYSAYGWGDLSSGASGEAMFGNNVHLSFQSGADRCVISNTHASLGYAAIKISYGSLYFASYSGSVSAGQVVTPTWNTVWHSGNIASTAEAQAGTDNAKGVTPAKAHDAIKAITVGSASRSWHDVKASRAAGTTYYNTNAYPIEVAVSADPGAGQWISLVIGGVYMASCWQRLNGCGVVPPGASYQLASGGGTPVISAWAELY